VFVPTVASGTSTNQVATTKFVTDAISNVSSLGTPNATTSLLGKIQLAGDLSGTAEVPLIKDGAITESKIGVGAVTSSAILDGAITSSKLVDGSVTVAKISATGTTSANTFLRGDGSWATPISTSAVLAVTVPISDNYTVLETDAVIYRNITETALLTFPSTLPTGKVFYIANTSGSYDWILSPTPVNTSNNYIAAGSSLMVITLGGGQIMVPTGY
jgi:hypothetical protein